MPKNYAIAFHDDDNDDEEGVNGRKFIDFIGRVNKRGFAIGPYWTSTGFSDSSPFTNGFLYGSLDEHGEMSGKLFFRICPW